MPVINRFADLLPEITEWRRDIHTHPELQFDVQRTAGIAAAKLREFGADDVICLLYTSPSPRDKRQSRMPSSA